ncbi:MAG: BrnT family toxin [Terracidiphilus sp.]
MEKAHSNFVKHGVRFEQACEVFFDPFIRLLDATAEDEAREAALGLTEDWTLLFVVHAAREDEVIRIISARPASSTERRLYEDD